MSDRRRDVRHSSRAPSRNNCRFSTNSRVSEPHKVINHLRPDKGALAAQVRRKRRQLDEADEDLRAAREKAEKNLEKMDDLILVEKNLLNEVEKLTGENACLQEDLERAQQLQAENARSKKEAVQAIVAVLRSHLDDDPEEEGCCSSARSGRWKSPIRPGDKPAVKRARRAELPGEAADDDDDSSSTSGAEDAARRDTGAPASSGGNEQAGPQAAPTQPSLGVELPAPPPSIPAEEVRSAGGPLVASPFSPTIRSATPGAL